MVAKRPGPDLDAPTALFGTPFLVVPKLGSNEKAIRSLLVDLPYEGRKGSGWQETKVPVPANEIRLTLVDFFDWQELDWKDYRYYKVFIESLEGHPEKVGRHGLLEAARNNWPARKIANVRAPTSIRSFVSPAPRP